MLTIDTPKIRATLGAIKGVPALPVFGRVASLMPGRAVEGGDADGGPPGAGRRRLLLVGAAAAVLLCAAGGAAFVALRRPAPPAVPVARAPAPPDPLRRLRAVGDQLNLTTRTIDGQLFVYAGTAAGVQTALSLAREEGSAHPRVVSLARLAAAISDAFRAYGFEVADDATDANGLSVALTVRVPATLRPLYDAVARGIAAAMAAVPGLGPVRVQENVKAEDGAFLLATLVGHPASRAFTVEGTKEVGDEVLGRFKLRAVETDRVELARDAGEGRPELRLIVPIHGDSRLASGTLDATKPAAFAGSILN